jgi:hypothetical protein
MYTENNEIIEDNMIVEFRYDMQADKEWRWVPLRVRYDKTAQLRNGEKNYGNGISSLTFDNLKCDGKIRNNFILGNMENGI